MCYTKIIDSNAIHCITFYIDNCIALYIYCQGEYNMKKQYNFRIEEILIKKIEYIAKENERNSTQEVTLAIKNHIKRYELENGQIPIVETKT